MALFNRKRFYFYTHQLLEEFYLDIYVNTVIKDLLQTQPEKGHFRSITKE